MFVDLKIQIGEKSIFPLKIREKFISDYIIQKSQGHFQNSVRGMRRG